MKLEAWAFKDLDLRLAYSSVWVPDLDLSQAFSNTCCVYRIAAS